MENNQPIEPEVVEEESLDIRRPSVAVTIDEIIAQGPEKALKIIEARVQIVTTLRKQSIKQTHPSDWVLYKDTKTGRVLAYLEDKGCQRVMPLWGVEVRNPTTPVRKNSEDGGSFAFSVIGDGYCKLTGQSVERFEGVRYSTERFALEQPEGIQREMAVQKAARANLEGRITRNLTGLNGVPLEELITVSGDKAFEAKASKGRGYGSQAERQGAQIAKSELAPEDEPVCPQSDDRNPHRMNFVPAGVSKASGKSYDAFWSCKQHGDKAVTLKHAEVLKEIEARKKASPPPAAETREPGDEP